MAVCSKVTFFMTLLLLYILYIQYFIYLVQNGFTIKKIFLHLSPSKRYIEYYQFLFTAILIVGIIIKDNEN